MVLDVIREQSAVLLETLGVLNALVGLGVETYHEPFTQAHLVTFGLIWAALVIYSSTSVLQKKPTQG